MTHRYRSCLAAVALFLLMTCLGMHAAVAAHLHYGWQKVDGLDVFFREGGPADAPTIVFLHGNPSSSIMYQETMSTLVDRTGMHVIAMDYPSFGYSDAPSTKQYRYTFDNLAQTVRRFLAARHIEKFALYMQDYGVPVGFRLIASDPNAVTALVIQNGVIHLDGFASAQDPQGELRRHWRERNPAIDKRRTAFVAGLAFPHAAHWTESADLDPDAVLLMTASEQRPGVIEARNDLWFDYGSNVARYPQWQALLRSLDVPVLVIWGSRDDFFTTPGAIAYLRDAPHAEVHVLDTVHFATMEAPDAVADLVGTFAQHHRLAPPAGPAH